ncbi:hypothetical protein BOTBODRAFT_39005 [Botryobasidium botryosum FD-172 SS1]|uniref:Pre-mRNA-splicing factor CWC24 n=1 Tax=Botryobasidium botryosum (strain FD-172 SS1) TaxID=930990 RepID=A0A067M6E8_BOTB1|nr:hypothetical protein BOTBODRAFT_39005 [Botryobasidium botryosum FD-172 SS1]
MAESSAPIVPFIRKKSRPTNSRKRSPTPPASSATDATSQVVQPSRKTVANPLIQGTKRTLSERELDGPDVQWQSAGSRARAEAGLELALAEEEEQAQSKRIKKREDDIPKAMRVGPVRNTSTIRTVTVIDYQPDVCKDYKETGYCGFGDTCKFLHDRGTYLQGWQLDKLAASSTQPAAAAESDSEEEDVPWACYICRKPYTDPVVTRCSHYFCSACAIKRFAKTPKCAACGAPTGGIFNRADKVISKMEAKRQAKDAGAGDVAVAVEGLGDEPVSD